jgi:hypothetical protein
MTLLNDLQLAVTKQKLQMLEDRYAELHNQSEPLSRPEQHTLRSFKPLINQLKEEIIRYEVSSRS